MSWERSDSQDMKSIIHKIWSLSYLLKCLSKNPSKNNLDPFKNIFADYFLFSSNCYLVQCFFELSINILCGLSQLQAVTETWNGTEKLIKLEYLQIE